MPGHWQAAPVEICWEKSVCQALVAVRLLALARLVQVRTAHAAKWAGQKWAGQTRWAKHLPGGWPANPRQGNFAALEVLPFNKLQSGKNTPTTHGAQRRRMQRTVHSAR